MILGNSSVGQKRCSQQHLDQNGLLAVPFSYIAPVFLWSSELTVSLSRLGTSSYTVGSAPGIM